MLSRISFEGVKNFKWHRRQNGKNGTLSTVLQNRESSVIRLDGHRVWGAWGALTPILLSEVRAGVTGSGEPDFNVIDT
jgi:hypothetical protein